MGCEDVDEGTERVELRWFRPDGEEAVVVVMTYATPDQATEAVDRCLRAFEDVRRLFFADEEVRRGARTGSHVPHRDSSVVPDGR
mgnify:CR=1 FL=1